MKRFHHFLAIFVLLVTALSAAPVPGGYAAAQTQPETVTFDALSRFSSGGHPLGFRAGAYSPIYPLVLDPALAWNTFLGGVSDDFNNGGIAADANGNLYVTGYSYATWQGATAPRRDFSSVVDAFVAKLDGNGSLVWNTFLGGSGIDRGYDIAVDENGYIYVIGDSNATWQGAAPPQRVYNSGTDTFVAKLDASGDLVWNTFLGGSGEDPGKGIAVDGSGNVYVMGMSDAMWQGATAPRRAYSSNQDVFAANLDTNGNFIWSTFLGGNGADWGYGDIRVDGNSNAYVTGISYSTWQGTNAPQRAYSSSADTFAAKLDMNGDLSWNTFLGGSGNDSVDGGVAVDESGNLYVTGMSNATWQGATAPKRAYTGDADAFVAKVDGSGNLTWNTFLGGSALDRGHGIAVGESSNLYVTGQSNATWQGTVVPWRAYSGEYDAFVAELEMNGNLTWNTFLGGSNNDLGYDLVIHGNGNLYVTGESNATWQGAAMPERSHSGGYDIFLAQISTISSNADLSNLVLSSGTLDPAFNSAATSYTASGAGGVTSITVTPTAADANATISVNGTTVTSGSASGGIPLNAGDNTITIIVTAEDGVTTKTYTVVVTRAVGIWENVGPAGFSAGEAPYTSLALDSSGIPYVAYQDLSSDWKATVKKFNGSTWETVGALGFSASSASWISIALDSSNMPYVAFAEYDADVDFEKLTVMRFNGSNWENVGTPRFSTSTASYNSLALDSSDTPYVAYQDGYYGAVVKKFNGSDWVTVGAPGFSGNAATSISLALDSQGTPYVGYVAVTGVISTSAAVVKYNGSNWVPVGSAEIASDAAGITLALDGSDTPYVAYQQQYYDEGFGSKTVAKKFNGSSWETLGAEGFAGYTASELSLALDSSDKPYLAYQDGENGYRATVLKFNGSSWQTVGAANFSAGEARSISLALDDLNSLYVAYEDFGSGRRATMMKYEPPDTPIIDLFTTPVTSTSLDIPITAFTASDNVGVTGYLITQSSEPPSPNDTGWSGTTPVTYMVTGDGSYTLYPWAKDAAGNVSAVFGSPRTVTVNTVNIGVISGTTYAADGMTPLEDIYVAVSGENYSASACTNASGQFTFSGLPVNVELRVQASPPWARCNEWHDYVHEFWPGVRDRESGEVITLTVENQDRTNIDFILEAGGVISGTTYQADGVTPAAHIAVSFQDEYADYTPSICTDENGYYEFHGLPFDLALRAWTNAFSDDWCNAGANYISEFWEESPDLMGAAPIALTELSPTRTNIDFTIDPAGSISGTVYEADGITPIPNVFMTLLGEELFNGWIFTDEMGNYTIPNVPLGVPVYVRAGGGSGGGALSGEFWPESPNLSGASRMTLSAETPDRTGIDFTLESPSITPDPYMRAWYKDDAVEAVDWPLGTHLTLEIEDMTTPLSPDYSAEMDFTESSNLFNLSGKFDIKPGMLVVLSGASLIRVVVVDSVTIAAIDQDLDTISGTTSPNAWMWMFFADSCDPTCRSTVADASGVWAINYSVAGPQGQPVADIGNGSTGAIHIPSGDGSTSIAWAVPDPNIDAWYLDGIIEAFGWPMGSRLTLEIEDPATSLSPDYSAQTDVTGTVPWDPTTPYAVFHVDDFEIQPGMIVRIFSGSMNRQVVVDNLTITNIDQDLNAISGTTTRDNWLWMFFADSCEPTCRSTVADENGVWSFNYDIPGEQGQPAADIGPMSSGAVHVPSGDGRTSVLWFIPPNVTSITRANADPTSASQVSFTVTFSEDVTNLDINDFTLEAGGEVTGMSIINITGSGSTRTVIVNTGSGNGTLGLNVASGATITDLDGNPLIIVPSMDREVYTIERILNQAILITPSGAMNTKTPTYRWSEVSGATWYYLWVNNASGTAVIKTWYTANQANCSGGTCSVTPTTALSAGTHRWWIQTYSNMGYGNWSAGMDFMVTPPGQAMLSSPTGDISTDQPTYSWEAVSGSTWYYLWVNGPSGNMIKTWYTAEQANCDASTCWVTPSTTLTPGAHRWWIQTWNSVGTGPWSDGLNFTVPTPPLPGAATLSAPSGSIGTNKPTYTWSAVPQASKYYLWVDGPAGNVHKQWYTAEQAHCDASTCSVTPNTTLQAGAYKWWIQTGNSAGMGSWSAGMNFTLALPGQATLSSPSGGTGANQPTYTWSAVPGATWYYLWVNNASGTAVIKTWYTAEQANCDASTCSVTPDTALTSGAHRWWIQTYNAAGYGPWSNAMGFSAP